MKICDQEKLKNGLNLCPLCYYSLGKWYSHVTGGDYARAQSSNCQRLISVNTLKKSEILSTQEHQAKHPAAEHEQTLEALQAKRARYDQRGTLTQLGFKPMQKPLLRASYEVAYQCIKVKASHSAPENPIKPCAIRIVELVLGTEASKKIKDVPLSNDVIAGRVDDMSCNILDQIVQEIKDSPIRISLQLDESTDVSNMSQLIVYARLFKLPCEEMGSEHQVLLFHTEVRWLSRGKILTRMAELKDEIAIFLREYQSNFAENFEDEVFILSLSYLADIFSHLNDVNTFMQGMYANNILCTEKIEAFKKKLALWKEEVWETFQFLKKIWVIRQSAQWF
ncbi:protein FAM200C-like [Oratosquilla oratoria]|uniref:protein FAM200C-like n=1 Tax=Oratosquilla oratoria TaxID=337810 RepID=UPI003F773BBA